MIVIYGLIFSVKVVSRMREDLGGDSRRMRIIGVDIFITGNFCFFWLSEGVDLG